MPFAEIDDTCTFAASTGLSDKCVVAVVHVSFITCLKSIVIRIIVKALAHMYVCSIPSDHLNAE